jgi:hypothetical protein
MQTRKKQEATAEEVTMVVTQLLLERNELLLATITVA